MEKQVAKRKFKHTKALMSFANKQQKKTQQNPCEEDPSEVTGTKVDVGQADAESGLL